MHGQRHILTKKPKLLLNINSLIVHVVLQVNKYINYIPSIIIVFDLVSMGGACFDRDLHIRREKNKVFTVHRHGNSICPAVRIQ